MSDLPDTRNQAPILVDVTSLADLGGVLRSKADEIHKRSTKVMFTMAGNHTNFAGGGMAEGATFQGVHDKAHDVLGEFLDNVINGLGTLATAALEISAAYGEADAYAATEVSDLDLHGVDGSPGPQTV
jgi:hypothetical protein